MAFIQDEKFEFVKISDREISNLAKEKFTVALDFDGVVTAPYKLKTHYLNQRGYKITEEQCSPVSCLKLNVTKEDYDYATKKAFTTSPEDLPLEKDFLKYFERLKKIERCKLFLITSRTEDMLDHLEKYLKYHKLKFDVIINTENKSKTWAIKIIKAKIFVDDSPFKIWQIMKEDKEILESCRIILYRNIQNKLEKSPSEDIKETNNWKELFNIIKTC